MLGQIPVSEQLLLFYMYSKDNNKCLVSLRYNTVTEIRNMYHNVFGLVQIYHLARIYMTVSKLTRGKIALVCVSQFWSPIYFWLLKNV